MLSGLAPKLGVQDAATLAAMHEAGGLVFYVAQLVRTQLANGGDGEIAGKTREQ